ncbi:MAG: 16S rRNA (adenine(1518)-N(6)/adenine(1519)-N(6))-dimethyltransferase RsmA [Nannocystaceae bacterium]
MGGRDGIVGPGELLRKYGLSPRKSWGQNFLHDVHVHEEIVMAAGAGTGERVVEIGAGLGTLTMHLLAAGAEVWAIERDRDLCEVLRKELGSNPRFTLFEANAITFDYARAASEGARVPVVGNLPYQITGELLFALLEHDARTGVWIVMVQQEVADRLCASPGTKQYGAPTVTLGRTRKMTRVCHVGPGSFLPPPRVNSTVVALAPRDQPRGEVRDPVGFQALVRAAFGQRRKTLLNSLSTLAPKEEVAAWCHRAGIDAGLRAERLDAAEFAALQRAREGSEDA